MSFDLNRKQKTVRFDSEDVESVERRGLRFSDVARQGVKLQLMTDTTNYRELNLEVLKYRERLLGEELRRVGHVIKTMEKQVEFVRQEKRVLYDNERVDEILKILYNTYQMMDNDVENVFITFSQLYEKDNPLDELSEILGISITKELVEFWMKSGTEHVNAVIVDKLGEIRQKEMG